MRMRTLARRGIVAFTLLELVVAISVIVILVAILIPMLGGARRRAMLASCANNLHHTGIAVENYNSEHHMMPLSYRAASGTPDYHGPQNDDTANQNVIFNNATWRDRRWPGLPGQLKGYLSNTKVFICPATPSQNPVPMFWNGQLFPEGTATPVA